MTATLEHARTTDRPRISASKAMAVAAAAAGAATLTNLTIYLVGRAAEIDMTMPASDGGGRTEVSAALVAAISIVTVILGAVVVWLAGRRWNRGTTVARSVGTAFAVVSIAGPLSLSAVDGSLKPLLAMMHLTCGLWFLYGTSTGSRLFRP